MLPSAILCAGLQGYRGNTTDPVPVLMDLMF